MRARLVGFIWAGWLCFGADNVDIYVLPLDANRAVVTGALTRLTTGPAIDQRPTLSRDGKRIAWETSSDGGANFEVRVRDLGSGDERAITSGPLREHMPAISRDGRRLVYDTHDGEKVSIFETAFGNSGAKPRLVVEENVGQGSFQFTADGKSVLYFHRAPPGTVGLLNLVTGQRTPLLQHPRYNLSLSDARLSPDGRWIAFPVPYAPHRARLAVARVGNGIVPESAWTYLTPESEATAAQPEWSPNGKWIYFLSDHIGGKLAVYALPFSPRSNAVATAVPKRIADFPAPGAGGPSIHAMRPRDIGLAVAKDKLALSAAAR